MPWAKFDWSNTYGAIYPPNHPGRIVILREHRPGVGYMLDRWYRDDGRQYLRTIMDKTGRSHVPELKAKS